MKSAYTKRQLQNRKDECGNHTPLRELEAAAHDGRLWAVTVNGVLRSLEEAEDEAEALWHAPGDEETGWGVSQVRMVGL